MGAIQRASRDVQVHCVILCMYMFKGMVLVVGTVEVCNKCVSVCALLHYSHLFIHVVKYTCK